MLGELPVIERVAKHLREITQHFQRRGERGGATGHRAGDGLGASRRGWAGAGQSFEHADERNLLHGLEEHQVGAGGQ